MHRPSSAAAGLLLAACAPAAPHASSAAPEPSPAIMETSTGISVRLGADGPARAAVDAPAGRVWAALPAVYEALGIPAEVSDPAAHTYGTQRFTRTRLGDRRTAEMVRCGNAGSGASAMSTYRIRLSILTTLRPGAGGGTELSTEVAGSATPVDGTSTGATRCVSTGELERRIAALAAEHAAR